MRMAKLFYEFLGRYKEWRIAKLHQTIGLIVVLVLGLLALLIPWIMTNNGVVLSSAVLVLFYIATRYYLKLNERVSHLYVNVHILHHHLIGKIEVGFCDHHEHCHCVENFRCYVLKKYGIILDNTSLR